VYEVIQTESKLAAEDASAQVSLLRTCLGEAQLTYSSCSEASNLPRDSMVISWLRIRILNGMVSQSFNFR